jgi:hypothetical protein
MHLLLEKIMLTFKSFITEAKAVNSLSPVKGPSFPEIKAQDRASESGFKKTGKKAKPTPEQETVLKKYTVKPSSLTDKDHEHLHNFLHSQATEHEGHVYRGFHPLHHEFEKADKEAGHEVPHIDIHHPHPMSTTTDARSASIFASDSDDYHKYLPKSLQTRLKTKNMEKLQGPADSYDKVAHMMRLKVPKGHPAAHIKDYSEYEGNDNIRGHSDESEVLFPKGQTVRIYRRPTVTRKMTGFGGNQRRYHMITWHGEVLPKDHKD